MGNKQAIYTISDPLYVDLVPTMFESVRKHYPEADLYLFMIGTGASTTWANGVKVIYIADVLSKDDLNQRICYYLGVELACSVRPDCFNYLFNADYSRVFYIDPDIYVFRRMAEVDQLLDTGTNGVITAHALKSISSTNGALTGGDVILLQVGIYNLGFIALSNTPETQRMVSWWREKLKWHCLCDTRNGLFVDQKWLEFLPVYFENFEVLKMPTYNLAPWNAEHYKITKRGKKFYADGELVAFIHFSGIKRMHAHYKDMPAALDFYLEEISRWENYERDFIAFKPRIRKHKITWDKICTLLYQEYVRNTDDFESMPMRSQSVYDYITGIDPHTGMRNYLRKVIELFPKYAVANLCRNDDLSFETVLQESRNPNSPYRGCIYPETVMQMITILGANAQSVVGHTPGRGFLELASRSVRISVRKMRSVLLHFPLARWGYASTKRIVMRAFRLAPVEATKPVDSKILKLLLRQAKDAELVK